MKMNNVNWTVPEIGDRVRLEKRILHNRTAMQSERHVLAAFEDIERALCHKKTEASNLSKFVVEKCGGICDRDTPLVTH